jgi:hypothetical protein
MSSRAELPTLAHPTFELRKCTLSTLCACSAPAAVACSRLELLDREEDGVDGEATLALTTSISVTTTAATRPNWRIERIMAPTVITVVAGPVALAQLTRKAVKAACQTCIPSTWDRRAPLSAKPGRH